MRHAPALTVADLKRLADHRALFGPHMDLKPGSLVHNQTAWLELDDFDKLLAAAACGIVKRNAQCPNEEKK